MGSRAAQGVQRRARAARILLARASPLRLALLATLATGLAPARADTAILSSGLRILDANYLFVEELDTTRLLNEALTYISLRLPEVRTQQSEDGSHILTAGACRLRVEAPPNADLPRMTDVLTKVAGFVNRCVSEPPEGLPPVESLLLAGVLVGLDPYSAVFDAARKTEHTIQFRGKLAGIGARIGIRDERLTLVTVYKDSPAYESGLDNGDIVLRVDGHSTTNMPVSDAVERIRGKVGTPLRLEIEREGEDRPLAVTVTRGLVTIPSVEARLLPSAVVHATISHFSQTTPSDFRQRVTEAMGGGAVAGVIIDLRDNSGGSMLGSSAIGDLFLEEGLLITTAGRGGSTVAGLTAEIRATSDTPFADLPVAMLTSPRTASGSELLAASLRNNDRAVLLGERTFGKGTVQKTYNLGAEASLKITVGHFLPNGLSIPGRGLEPDIEVRRFRRVDSGILTPPTGHGEKLPFWLETPPWLNPSTEHPASVISYYEDLRGREDEIDANATDEDGEHDENDPIIGIAADLLSRFGAVSVRNTLANAKQWLAGLAENADSQLASDIAELGVDWRRPPAVATIDNALNPSLRVGVAARSRLNAGEENELDLTVTNTGARPLYRLFGSLVSDARFLRGRGLLFGYLAAGESRTWKLNVEPPKDTETSRVELRMELLNEAGHVATSGPLYLAVAGSGRPRLAHRVTLTPGSAEGVVEIAVDVENRGNAAAQDVRIFMKHPDTDEVELIEGAHTIETLEPGARETAALSVRVLASSTERGSIELTISEPAYHIFLESKIELGAGLESTAGRWREAPTIRVSEVIHDGPAGSYEVVAEIADDDALASLWSSLDGHKIDYVDATGRDARVIRLSVPWQPERDVQRLEITAKDTDGLTSWYVADL
jgi:carboxyl-terminal processing protease